MTSGHEHTFLLRDSQGVEHAYVCNPHMATEGVLVIARLMRLGGPSIASIFQSLYASIDTSDLTLSSKVNVASIVGKVDWTGLKISEAVKQFVDGLASSVDGVELIKDILAQTNRDKKYLKDDAIFDLAYRRNYLELLKAAWEVIRYNDFLLGVDTLMSGGEDAE